MLEMVLKIYESDISIGMIGCIGAVELKSDLVECGGKCGKVYEKREEIKLLNFDNNKCLYREIEAVDGVIIITRYNIPWREDILKGWHFYDISQGIEYQKAGFKIVVPCKEESWILHN